ncbi:MAG TPA: site-2 protease family protein [Actinospica sp.]|nr:site-2 protease family protein [Actinospica sp.]
MNFRQRVGGRGAFDTRRSGHGTGRISTVFLAVVAATATGGVVTWLSSSSSTGNGPKFAVFVFVFGLYFTVLCLHEFGHAYTAHREGDASIAARGYLDLNPVRYVNPVLSLLLPAFYLIIGALPLPGGAVLVNRGAIRTKRGAALVSAAGPLTNVAAAGISMALVALFAPTVSLFGITEIDGSQPHAYFWMGLSFFAYLQVAVAILNLIPVPGLDGYGIIEPYLRYETRRALEPVRQYGILIVLLLLFFFPPVRDGFSTLVNDILRAGQQPAGGAGQGQLLFQFWHSS